MDINHSIREGSKRLFIEGIHPQTMTLPSIHQKDIQGHLDADGKYISDFSALTVVYDDMVPHGTVYIV